MSDINRSELLDSIDEKLLKMEILRKRYLKLKKDKNMDGKDKYSVLLSLIEKLDNENILLTNYYNQLRLM